MRKEAHLPLLSLANLLSPFLHLLPSSISVALFLSHVFVSPAFYVSSSPISVAAITLIPTSISPPPICLAVSLPVSMPSPSLSPLASLYSPVARRLLVSPEMRSVSRLVDDGRRLEGRDQGRAESYATVQYCSRSTPSCSAMPRTHSRCRICSEGTVILGGLNKIGASALLIVRGS